MSNNRVIGVLKRARALVARKDGWIKNYFIKRVGTKNCYCAWGAICRATKSSDLENAALKALNDDGVVKAYITRNNILRSTLPAAATFNDAKTRTQAQIVALFDRTIARLEKQNA